MRLANRFSRLERSEIELELLEYDREKPEMRRVERLICEAEILSSLHAIKVVRRRSGRQAPPATAENRAN